MRRRTTVLAGLLVVGLAMGVSACGDDDDEGDEAATTTVADDMGGDAAGTREEGVDGGGQLAIEGFAFGAVTAAPGAKVTVTNADSVPHTVTADEGDAFDVRVDGGGEGELVAPDEPGTYAFHCEIHSQMKGELVVE